MKFLLFALCLALPFGAAAEAAKPKAKKTVTSRKPSNAKAPYRVVSLVCQDEAGEDAALGIAQLSIDAKDSEAGYFGLTLYMRSGRGSVTPKSLNGAYTTVPDGFILQAQWAGLPGDQLVIHAHPRDKTSLPGVSGRLGCRVTSKLEQL